MNTTAAAARTIPWQRSVAWLLFLGPFFFISYGFANNMAARWQVSEAHVYDWERHIPFIPWTIVPYWSIDLLYGLSFLLCCNRLELDRHALRLLTTQIISVACFLAFPLHFAFERPHVEGFFGALFAFIGNKVFIGDGLCTNETALEVTVNHTRGLGSRSADTHSPGTHFLFPGCKVGAKPQQMVGSPSQLIHTRFGQTDSF